MAHDGVTIITATGERQAAFNLCWYYMSRQTVCQTETAVEWIIVDDGRTPTVCPSMSKPSSLQHWNIRYIRPETKWEPGLITQGRNLLAAIEEASFSKIIFVEDDDWYSPEFLAFTAGMLDLAPIAGEGGAKYYNIATRQYQLMRNGAHASLCQTGIRASMLPYLRHVIYSNAHYIDCELWQAARDVKLDACLTFGPGLCVGMKGLPGRAGIGVGHKPQRSWSNDDKEMSKLSEWIGTDAEFYKPWCAN